MRTNLAMRQAVPPFARLAALADLSEQDVEALHVAAQRARSVAACREISRQGEEPLPPSIVLDGWAARVRHFSDGRRQILNVVLPGEPIRSDREQEALAPDAIVALTTVRICPAPDPSEGDSQSGLAAAYKANEALVERYLCGQIARLGRMSAVDRMTDWLLELQERLVPVESRTGEAFPMPLTQEMLADALGLTSVHVNRTLQLMRREGLIEMRNGMVRLLDPARLVASIGYKPPMRRITV